MQSFKFYNLVIRSLALGLLLTFMAACEDPVAPGAELFAGSYSATEFRIVTATGDVDLLASGAILGIDIHDDGSFQGHLTVPENESVLQEIDTAISGWWQFSDQRLTLSGIPDTFINDARIAFREERSPLLLSNSVGDAEVFVVLTKGVRLH